MNSQYGLKCAWTLTKTQSIIIYVTPNEAVNDTFQSKPAFKKIMKPRSVRRLLESFLKFTMPNTHAFFSPCTSASRRNSKPLVYDTFRLVCTPALVLHRVEVHRRQRSFSDKKVPIKTPVQCRLCMVGTCPHCNRGVKAALRRRQWWRAQWRNNGPPLK